MNLREKFTFRRLSNPKSVARAVLKLVLAEEHYYQGTWLSTEYFPEYDPWSFSDQEAEACQTGTALRNILNQNICGTTGCVAGNTVILTLPSTSMYNWKQDEVVHKDGGREGVTEYAAKRLGIAYEEADWLFSGDRPKSDVVEALTRLSKGKTIEDMVPWNWR